MLYKPQQIILDKVLTSLMKLVILEKRPSEKIWHVKKSYFSIYFRNCSGSHQVYYLWTESCGRIEFCVGSTATQPPKIDW